MTIRQERGNGLRPGVAGLTLMAASAGLFAEPARGEGFYLGGGYGRSEFFTQSSPCGELLEEAQEELEEQRNSGDALVAEAFARILAGSECRDDETDSAVKLFLGYRFNRYVALELGYVDFGEASLAFSSHISEQAGTLEGEGRVSVSAEALSLSGLFGFPVGERLDLFARLGISAWEAEARGRASGIVRRAGGGTASRVETYSLDDSDADVNYGAGARFRVGDKVTIRAEYERFEVMDIDVISAAVEFFPGR